MRTDRAIAVEGLCNARDLGGLLRANGDVTPFGTFYRAENLERVTARGWGQLHDLGVRSVVDLRQPAEIQNDGYTVPSWATRIQVDHDGLEGHPEFWADYWNNLLVTTPIYYLPHLNRLPERSAAVLAALANAPEGGVLFHCRGGRDRTGIISLILLALAQTDPEAIVDDFLLSLSNAEHFWLARGRENPEPKIAAVDRKSVV